MEPKVTMTDQGYFAAQRPEVRELMQLEAEDRPTRALELATRASDPVRIDEVIQVWGWSATLTMTLREEYGMPWVPNMMQQNVYVVPFPGVPVYDPLHPPPGAIKVSTKSEDYPPFEAPASPVAPASAMWVGNPFGFQIDGKEVYAAPAQLRVPEGTERQEDGKRFQYHLLGNSLMSPQERTGVWLLLGPVSPGSRGSQ